MHQVILIFDIITTTLEDTIDSDALPPIICYTALQGYYMINTYYILTDDSIVYRIAMSMSCELPYYYLAYCCLISPSFPEPSVKILRSASSFNSAMMALSFSLGMIALILARCSGGVVSGDIISNFRGSSLKILRVNFIGLTCFLFWERCATLVLFLPCPQNRARKSLCNLRTLKPHRVDFTRQ